MNRAHLILALLAYLALALAFNFPLLQGFMDQNRVFYATGLSLLCPMEHCIFSEVLGWNNIMAYLGWNYLGDLFLGFLLNPFQMSVFFKVAAQFIAFAGAFLLADEYLSSDPEGGTGQKWRLAAAFAGGLLYGMNPSYWIGDWSWVGIEFAYALFPLIVWSFHRSVSRKGPDLSYSVLCAFLMAVNDGEHMLWAGFHIFLALYAGFLFIKDSLERKKVEAAPLVSFAVTFVVFLVLISYKYLMKSISLWQQSLSLSLSGVDIPWHNGTLLNLINGMSHMELTAPYSGFTSGLGFLNPLWSLTLLLPLLAIMTILLCRKRWPIAFYWLLLAGSVLVFFIGSPLKWLHYWIFFNTPFGALFRTWRIPAAYISIAMSVLVPFGLFWAFRRIPERANAIRLLIFSAVLFIIVVWAWPLFVMGDAGKLESAVVPPEYPAMAGFLSSGTQCLRTMVVPGATGKPYWSPDIGFPADIFHLATNEKAVEDSGVWSHYYDHSASDKPYSLLKGGDMPAFAKSLRFAGTNCVLVNNDVPSLGNSTANYIGSLDSSGYFERAFSNGSLDVFKLKEPAPALQPLSATILVDGGYRAVDGLLRDTNDSCGSCGFVFMDQNPPSEALGHADFILTDKSEGQLESGLVFSQLAQGNGSEIIYPYKFVLDHDPGNKWSRASYLDPAQLDWHPYLSLDDYSSDFDYFQGIAFIDGPEGSFTVPIEAPEDGNYALLIRYFESERGCSLNFTGQPGDFKIGTYGGYDGFEWYNTSVYLSKGANAMQVESPGCFNALSAMAVIPEQQYSGMAGQSLDYLSGRRVIKKLPDPIQNPSFENGLVGWNEVDYPGYGGMRVSIDNSTSLEGPSSILLERANGVVSPAWAEMESGWVEVSGGEALQFRGGVKAQNISIFDIAVEGFDGQGNKTVPLYEIPFAGMSASGWNIYKGNLTVPGNITRVRLVFGAGCSDNSSSPCKAWFDGMGILRKQKFAADALAGRNTAAKAVLSSYEISSGAPGLPVARLSLNSSGPFMLFSNQPYSPSVVAVVHNGAGGEAIARSVPIYGLYSGFWINSSGQDITIDIQERNFALLQSAYWLSTLIFICVAVFLAWRFPLRMIYSAFRK
jgi:hypothetical protein